MMNEKASDGIDWDSLPDKANWVAMDGYNERWWWYLSRPYKDDSGMVWLRSDADSFRDYDVFQGPPCDDWTNSLQSRPSPSSATSSSSTAVPVIEPLTEQERTVVNAEIASLNEQLRSAQDDITVLLTRLKNAEDDWKKVSEANVRHRDEIASLNEQLQRALKTADAYRGAHDYAASELDRISNELDATLKSIEEYKSAITFWQSVREHNQTMALSIETLKATLDEYKSDNEGLRTMLASQKVIAASKDVGTFSWAIQEVINGNTVTRDGICESHWRLGLFAPVNSVVGHLRMVWTNGTSWNDATFSPADFSASWSVYDPYETSPPLKGEAL